MTTSHRKFLDNKAATQAMLGKVDDDRKDKEDAQAKARTHNAKGNAKKKTRQEEAQRKKEQKAARTMKSYKKPKRDDEDDELPPEEEE